MKPSRTNRPKQTSSRRNFLKTGVAAGIGIPAVIACGNAPQTPPLEENEKGTLNDGSRRVLEMFDLQYPIFQAAPGGPALAIAVAGSGAMGAIDLWWRTPEDVRQVVSMLLAETQGKFYANYVLHNFNPEALDAALEAGCPNVQFSWGIPGEDVCERIKTQGAKLGIQVSSKSGAAKALERNPDFLFCQGNEAGGHVQATSRLYDGLEEIVELAGEIPVMAAGGISSGHHIRKAIHAGASGVVLGTRLMATAESNAHDVYKRELVEAKENDTVYTNCFNRGWEAMHRVLRNPTFREWESLGCPTEGNRPGESDVVATHPDFGPVLRYSGVPPLTGFDGSVEEMAMYAGEGAKDVDDVPTAEELMRRLWAEFENE